MRKANFLSNFFRLSFIIFALGFRTCLTATSASALDPVSSLPDFENISISTPRNHLGAKMYNPFDWKHESEVNSIKRSKSPNDTKRYINGIPIKEFIENTIQQMETEESSTAETLEFFELVKKEYGNVENVPLEEHATNCCCFHHLPKSAQNQIFKAAEAHMAIMKEYKDHHLSDLSDGGSEPPSRDKEANIYNLITESLHASSYGKKSTNDFNDFNANPSGKNSSDIFQRIFLPYKFDYVLSKFGIGFVIFFVGCGIVIISSTWTYYQIKIMKESTKTLGNNSKSSEESISRKSIDVSSPYATNTNHQRRASVDLTKLDLI